jgi:hypothetical protein
LIDAQLISLLQFHLKNNLEEYFEKFSSGDIANARLIQETTTIILPQKFSNLEDQMVEWENSRIRKVIQELNLEKLDNYVDEVVHKIIADEINEKKRLDPKVEQKIFDFFQEYEMEQELRQQVVNMVMNYDRVLVQHLFAERFHYNEQFEKLMIRFYNLAVDLSELKRFNQNKKNPARAQEKLRAIIETQVLQYYEKRNYDQKLLGKIVGMILNAIIDEKAWKRGQEYFSIF